MTYKIGIAVTAYQEKEILEGQFYPKMKEMGITGSEIVQFDGMIKDYFDPNPSPTSLSYDGSILLGKSFGALVCKIPERLPFIRWLNWRLWTCGMLKFDAVIALDADEYLTGDWNKFKQVIEQTLDKQEGKPLLGLAKFIDHNGTYPLFNRIHKVLVNPGKMIIKMAHYIYLNRDTGEKLQKTGLEKFGGIFPYISINHNDDLRPDWRERWHCKWQTLNHTREGLAIQKFRDRMKTAPEHKVYFENSIPY